MEPPTYAGQSEHEGRHEDGLSDIDQLLALSQDELLKRLGECLPPDLMEPRGAGPLHRGRRWMNEHWLGLRAKVCGNSTVHGLRSDNRLLLLELTTIIATAQLLPATQAVYVAAIVIKLGLDTLCAGEDPLPMYT